MSCFLFVMRKFTNKNPTSIIGFHNKTVNLEMNKPI